jgi:hypothetical protein
LDNNFRHEKSVSPVPVVTRKEGKPRVKLGHGSGSRGREAVGILMGVIADSEALNIQGNLGINQLATKVLRDRNRRLVVVVQVVGQERNVTLVDTVENLLDRLVDDGRELGCSGTLENASTANILINDGIEILRLPEGVLLEVELKVVIKDRDESNGLHGGTHSHHQEELDILSGEDLVVSLRVGSEDTVNQAERFVEVSIALEKRWLASGSSEAFFQTVDEVTGENRVRAINPARLVLDVEKLHASAQHFAIGHLIKVNSLAGFVATKPDLLAVVVQLLDNVVLVLLELSNALLLGDGEDLLIHLSPETNTSGRKFVDRFAHLRANGDNTTSRPLVGLLPLTILEARSVDDGLLGSPGGVCLLCNHHAATEQATIEGHGRVAVLLGPLASDVWVSIIGATEATTSNQNDVLLSSDSAIHLKNRLVEILKRVVTTTTASSPLEKDRERRVGLGDVDDSLDGINGTGLEGDVLKTQRLNVLVGNLDGRNTSTDGKTLNGNTLSSELTNKRNLP